MRPVKFTLQTYAERRLRAQTRGYPIPKWVCFCQDMLDLGLDVRFVDAKTTVSKYVYLRKNGRQFKVRFSYRRCKKSGLIQEER